MRLLPRSYYLDDLFDNFLSSEDNNMKCDIYEKDGAYHIEMDIPGYKKDEIKVECNNGNIVVTAEKAIFFKGSSQNVLSPKGSRST